MNRRRTILLTGVGTAILAGMIAGSSFALVRTFHEGSAAQAEPPLQPTAGPGATPLPGATPNTREPGWYVPYLNADSKKPQFQGRLAGIDIRPFDSSVPAEDAGGCPPGTSTLRELSSEDLNKESIGIRLGNLAGATSPVGPPVALECDGRLVTLRQFFDVSPGQGGGAGAGSLKVFRSSVGHRFWLPAPADRWSPGVVAGRPAAVLKPVVDTVGTSAVILSEGQGYTALVGEGVTVEFLQLVAEEIER